MVDRKWFDWPNLILGVWLVISPWILRFSSSAAAAWTTVILGIAVVAVSVWALYQAAYRAPEWVNLVLGVLLFLAPWVLGFSMVYAAAWNAWVLGVIVAVLAILTFTPQVSGMHHQPSH